MSLVQLIIIIPLTCYNLDKMTEYSSESGGVYAIRALTPETENKLRVEIARTNGEVDLIMHPQEAKDKGYFPKIKDHIQQPGNVTFVFEREAFQGETTHDLGQMGTPKNIVTVPTRRNDPTPTIKEGLKGHEQWITVATILKNLGVKKIKLGGMEYIQEGDSPPQGCVPEAKFQIEGLKELDTTLNFEVEYNPTICFPAQPRH